MNVENECKSKNKSRFCPSEHQQIEVGSLEQSSQRNENRKDKAHVRFTIRRRRLLDPDNAYASIKDLLDGLRDAGLILDDSEKRITLEVNQEKSSNGHQEETIIEIEYSDVDSQTRFLNNRE